MYGYEPSPRQIAGLENADIFFYVGIGLEQWADKVVENFKSENVKVVRVSKDLDLLKFEEEDIEHHKHEGEGSEDHHHHNSVFDPHVWVDPSNMKIIAATIKDELIKLDPVNKNYYNKKFEGYENKIKKLDNKYKEALENKKYQYIIVSHNAFGYLGRSYGFEQLSVTGLSPHAEPSPKNIARLIDIAREYNLKYVLMETLSSPRVVRILAEEDNLKVLTLNPVAGLTEEEKENGDDYFQLWRKILSV